MFLRTDDPDTKEILVLDSEGIFSIERSNPNFDKQLVIFCLAVSNLLLINIKGEIGAEVERVLQVAIFALNKISAAKCVNNKARIQFVLRDQTEKNPDSVSKQFEIIK